MKIQYVETYLDSAYRLLIIVVDDETEIMVKGYGGGDYSIRLRSVSRTNPSWDPAALLGIRGSDYWGSALVCASPTTIAHLVMDVLNNQ